MNKTDLTYAAQVSNACERVSKTTVVTAGLGAVLLDSSIWALMVRPGHKKKRHGPCPQRVHGQGWREIATLTIIQQVCV